MKTRLFMPRPSSLIEYEQGMVTGITEMTVVGRAFLSSECRTVRTVHVQNNFFNGFALMNLINPLTGKIHQALQISVLCKNLCFKSTHLAGRSSGFVFGSFAYNLTHGRIQIAAEHRLYLHSLPNDCKLIDVTLCCIFLPVRLSLSSQATISINPNTSSISHYANKPASLVTFTP